MDKGVKDLALLKPTVADTALQKLAKAQRDEMEKKDKTRKEQLEKVKEEKTKDQKQELGHAMTECGETFEEMAPTMFRIGKSRLRQDFNRQELAVLGEKLAVMLRPRAYASFALAIGSISAYYVALVVLAISIFWPVALAAEGLAMAVGMIVAVGALKSEDGYKPSDALFLFLAALLLPLWFPIYWFKRAFSHCYRREGEIFTNGKEAIFQFKSLNYLRLLHKIKKLGGRDYFPGLK